MKMKKCIPALLTAMTVGLTACGESLSETINPPTEISFSWWGNDVRNDYTIEALNQFRLLYPAIDVQPSYSEFDGFNRRVAVEIASGKTDDVMQINFDWLYKYSSDGDAFYDLNELSDYIDLENFSESDLEYGTINGKLNGIATALNAMTFYYNADLYDKYGLSIPNTWEDLFTAAEVMSPDGIYPLYLNKKAMWLSCYAYMEQLTGDKFFGEDGSISITAEDLAIMLSFYKSLIENKVAAPIEDADKDDFINCKAAGAVYWISDAEYYCMPLEENGYEVVIGDYLVEDNAKLFGWYAKPTSLYCISKDTENPEAAAKLLDYLLNSEEMASCQGLEKGIPLSSSALECLESMDMLTGLQYEADCKREEFSEELECINPKLEEPDLLDAFKSAFDNIYYNNADIDEEATALYDEFVEILE